MAVIIPRALLEATQIPIAATTQYTAPTATRTIIDKMTVTNTTGNVESFTCYITNAGAPIGDNNRVIQTRAVGPGATALCSEMVGHILNTGDTIVTESSALALTVRISGREIYG